MKRIGVSSIVILMGLLAGLFLWNSGRESVGQSPDSWRQLTLADFVQTMDELTSSDEPLSDELMAEVRSQSAERLVNAIEDQTGPDYGDLVRLFEWGRPNLTAEESDIVLAGLVPKANQIGPWTFEKMQQVHGRMLTALMPPDTVHALTLTWLDGRDLQTVADAEQLRWLTQQVQVMDRSDTAPLKFTAKWTGSVTAQTTGDYTFSISPYDLNFGDGAMFRTQTMSVQVAGEKVVDATRDAWNYKGAPVTLSAGKTTSIQIDLSFDCSERAVFEDRPAVAMLYWEGPGMTKRLVPSSSLSPPEGNQQGLQAEYVLYPAGQDEKTISRIDLEVHFIWYHGSFIDPTNQELRSRLAQQYYSVVASQATMATWEKEGQAKTHNWLGADWAFLETLSTEKQRGWASLLLAHPVLLTDCSRRAVSDLYRRCRFGAPEEALQLVGTWAQAHFDEAPAFAADYYQANRQDYREFSRKMVWQYPGHLDRLDQEYLELPDGQCVLPIAYTLSYGYWVQKRITEWIDKLDARLADENLTGDKRVNWLLARAQAQEIRHSRVDRRWWTTDKFMSGRGWIQEAFLVAKTEAVKLRAFKELAARHTVDERIAWANKVLDDAAERCTSAESTTKIAAWRSELAAVELAIQKRHEEQEAFAQEAYAETLRARYQRALDRGDSPAANRYKEKLAAATGDVQ